MNTETQFQTVGAIWPIQIRWIEANHLPTLRATRKDVRFYMAFLLNFNEGYVYISLHAPAFINLLRIANKCATPAQPRWSTCRYFHPYLF